jgi:hypothetical protein
MKKILILACAMSFGFAAQAAVTWDWWFGHSSENISGCALGIAAGNAQVSGAQVALCAAKAETFNAGAQVSIGYSQVDTLRNGAQAAIVANARKAALQFGLICINDGGFLPVFVLFNFDKTMFGGKH